MKATICDYCKEPIEDINSAHAITVNGNGRDMCDPCFHSSVILAECRRVRIRKVRKPRKARKTGEEVRHDDGAGKACPPPIETPLSEALKREAEIVADPDWMAPVREKFAEIKARQS